MDVPAEAITDVGVVKDWAPTTDNLKDEVIDRCILTASQFIEEYTGLIIAAPTAPIVHNFDGNGRRIGGRSQEFLYVGQRIDVPASVAVRENNVALTVAQGFQTAIDVIVLDQKDGRLGVLHRNVFTGTAVPQTSLWPWTTGWAAGIQNIEVTYTPGWSTPPEDIVQVCVEMAWGIFKGRHRVGKTSRSSGRGTSVSYLDDLSTFSRETLGRYRRYAV